VGAFGAAARAGDREAMYGLLGPETRRRLETAAARATALVSGRQYHGADMIRSVVPSGSRTFELIDHSDDRALVDIIDQRGARSSIQVVRVGDHWRGEVGAQRAPQPLAGGFTRKRGPTAPRRWSPPLSYSRTTPTPPPD